MTMFAQAANADLYAASDPILNMLWLEYVAAMILAFGLTLVGGWALVRRYRDRPRFKWLFALWLCYAVAAFWYALGLPRPF